MKYLFSDGGPPVELDLQACLAKATEAIMAHGPAEELTGNRRSVLRFGIICTMVLQVEVSYFDYRNKKWAVKWRDATPADLPGQEVRYVDG